MQRVTLAQPVTLQGSGLFSAQPATIRIAPSNDGSGIRFAFDANAQATIEATIGNLSPRPVHPVFTQMHPRCTTLGTAHDTHSVATIEHIMSTLFGLGITDGLITISSASDHPEIPILDGSAKPFTDAIRGAGLRTLSTTIEPIRVHERIQLSNGDASIVIEPSQQPGYTYHIDYPGTPIGSTSVSWSGDTDEYTQHIAPARTFSLEHETKAMQSAGLFTHLTTRDMLVIGADGPIDNDWRLPDECARHKLLDLIGDLALVGSPLIAKVIATRSGHTLAHEAARAILAQQHESKI